MKNKAVYISTLVIFILLLITPTISQDAAKKGLSMWAGILIPALLPTMIITSFLVKINATTLLTKIFHPLFAFIYKTSKQGTFCLLSGILCGYPMGVKCVNDLLNEERISVPEAQQLIAVCSYPSPIFMVSYVIINKLNFTAIIPAYLASTYLSTIPINFIALKIYNDSREKAGISNKCTSAITLSSFEECVNKSCKTMLLIGVYIMYFSIAAGWINSLAIIPTRFKILISLLLEMTTGVDKVSASKLTLNAKTLLCLFATSFGGLCTMVQCCSVIKSRQLNKMHYLLFKLLHGIISCTILELILLIGSVL